MLDVRDLLVADAQDALARGEAGARRRAGGRHVLDPDAVLVLQAHLARARRCQVEQREAPVDRVLVARRSRARLCDLARRTAGELDLDLLLLAVAQHDELDLVSGLDARHAFAQRLARDDVLAVERAHDVARAQSGLLGRAVGDHLGHQRAAEVLQAEGVGEVARQRLQRDAQPAALDAAAGLQAAQHRLHRRAGDREADAVGTARAGVDRGVDADHAALQVDQRSAAVARVDRRVGLDEVLVGGDADLAAALGADDAGGDGVVQAEGVAHGDDPVARLELVAVAEARRLQLVRIDVQRGEVGVRVDAEQLRGELAPVAERDLERVGVLDHVRVGDDRALLVDDHAAALAGELRLLAQEGLAVAVGREEAVEQVAWHRAVRAAERLRAVVRNDADDRGRDGLRRLAEGERHGARGVERGSGVGGRRRGGVRGRAGGAGVDGERDARAGQGQETDGSEAQEVQASAGLGLHGCSFQGHDVVVHRPRLRRRAPRRESALPPIA